MAQARPNVLAIIDSTGTRSNPSGEAGNMKNSRYSALYNRYSGSTDYFPYDRGGCQVVREGSVFM